MTSACERFALTSILFLGLAAAVSAEPETLILSGHADTVVGVAFSPDGRLLATAGDDGSVRIWDGDSGAEQKSSRVHKERVKAVAWTADGKYVMSSGDNGHMRVSDMRGRVIKDIDYNDTVAAIASSPDGALVAFGLMGGGIRLVDPKTWSPARELGVGDIVEALAFNSDGTMLAAGDSSGTVTLYDPRNGRKLRRCTGHTENVRSVSFRKDGSLLASGSDDGSIRLWDPSNGRAVRTLAGHSDKVRGVAFSPDGLTLASVSEDDTVRTWSPSSGDEEECWDSVHKGNICCVAYRPDGKALATGGEDHTAVLWFPKSTPKPEPPKPEPPKPEPPKPDLKKMARTQIDAIAASLKTFESDFGYLPHSVNKGMVSALSGGRRGGLYRFDKSELNGQGEVIDPWGNPLCYRSPGSKASSFDLYSCGPNGRDDGGAGDDIGNW